MAYRSAFLCSLLLVLSSGSCTSDWKIAGTLNHPRSGHTATLLRDGTVLIVGGMTENTVLSSVERYDPQTETFTEVAPLRIPRARHTAVRLDDGTVLVIGGATQFSHPTPITETVERFDPNSNSWTTMAPMNMKRWFHTTTKLQDGRVLVVAGAGIGSTPDERRAEIYDPAANSWTLTGSTRASHIRGTATLLLDGKVLVAGGLEYGNQADDPLLYLINYSELFDPATGAWTELAIMNETPFAHTATLLPDATVLVAGGRNTGQTYLTALRYQPNLRTGRDFQSDLWQFSGDLNQRRTNHQALLLADGSVIVTGGHVDCIDLTSAAGGCAFSTTSVERFRSNVNSTVAGTWEKQDSMYQSRGDHTMTFLPKQCKVVVIGGYDFSSKTLVDSAETFPVPCVNKLATLNPNR
jgi:N-acetylneuraminic acid mutarotase